MLTAMLAMPPAIQTRSGRRRPALAHIDALISSVSSGAAAMSAIMCESFARGMCLLSERIIAFGAAVVEVAATSP